MKIKFNLFERVAGLFVLVAVCSSIATSIAIGVKKGWFDPKINLITHVHTADGVHPGTPVNFSGLRIGSVDNVLLKAADNVEIHFQIRKQFSKQISSNSVVKIVRPFIIGEKALDIVASETQGNPIFDGQILQSEHAPDFLEFLGGNKLGRYMESLDKTMLNLQKLAEAFLSDERSDRIIELFDQLFPLMEQMSSMASEVSILSASLNEKKKLAKVLDDFLKISKEMNKALPVVAKDMPDLSKNILLLTNNLNQLSSDMKEIVPVIKEIAPNIPGAAAKATIALDEIVITLQAMQKTWMLKSNVKEVKEERKRLPASDK